MTQGVIRARWWVVIALLLGIQADVAPLQHAGENAHTLYNVLGAAAWLTAAFCAYSKDEPSA